MEGILSLFAPDGTEITASPKDLLKLEAQSTRISLYRRVFNDTPGTYWLLSARPGHVRMVLQITLHLGYVSKEWDIGWCLNGIASYSHWDVDSAVKTFTDRRELPTGTEDDWYRSTRLPANVEALMRQHVYYVEGAKGNNNDNVRQQFAVKTVSPAEATRRLSKVTNHDTTALVSSLAGRCVEIMELMLELTFFCEETEGLSGYEYKLARALTKQHIKLFFLARRLGKQLSQA